MTDQIAWLTPADRAPYLTALDTYLSTPQTDPPPRIPLTDRPAGCRSMVPLCQL
jgi:hypothetical protein